MSKLAGRYTLAELLLKDLSGGKPLIDQMLYERDNILMVGREKSNKSTFWLQACCALTSGEPFLGEYDVPRPIDCAFIQAEGKLSSTRQNAERMTKVIPCDQSKLSILYYPSIPLNTDVGFVQIKNDLDSWRRPELIVIDPLYQSMAGDLTSQLDSSAMTANLRLLSEYYQCAIVLIHHAHRPRLDDKGTMLNEGDNAIFGSFVWKAWPDSVFLIEKVQGHKNYRRFSCDTQRMGNVVDKIDLLLVEPEPYYLQIKEGQPIDAMVRANLNGEPFTIKDLIHRTGKSRQHLHNSVQRLMHLNEIAVIDPTTKPLVYRKLVHKIVS